VLVTFAVAAYRQLDVKIRISQQLDLTEPVA